MQANQAEITQQNQQEYFISGVVDFSTVPDLMRRATDFFKSHKITVHGKSKTGKSASGGQSTSAKNAATITVDMSQITACNSAGLALMLEMTKQAEINNIKLHFEKLPESLLTIAKAYGI